MGYQPLEKLLPRSGNSVYKLVRLAAKRATELAEGKPRLVEALPEAKIATIALEEILSGKVVSKEVADLSLRKKKASADADSKEASEVSAA